jgi:hypothetical protein
MGTLRDLHHSADLPLRPVHTVGRADGSDLCLTHASVSACHAVIRWLDGRWVLRDLGSTNGTRVNGAIAPAGVLVPLPRGARLEFGADPRRFQLTADGPAVAFAIGPDGAVLRGTPERLVLPGGAVIAATEEGWADTAGAPVRDGAELVAVGLLWRLRLPEGLAPTHRLLTLADVVAVFEVSANEEFARLTLRHEGGEIPLEPRSFHYHLLVLARARRDDPAPTEAERGWLDTDRVCQMLACNRNQLDVYVHRARRQLADAGLRGAEGVVERRIAAGSIRFGVARIEERRA